MNFLRFVVVIFFGTYCFANTAEPNITIFIHGTLPPLIDKLIHAYEAPLGLTSASKLSSSFVHKKLIQALSQADSELFPVEHMYVFGWSGDLSVSGRRDEARRLLRELKKLDGKITLICHSHGCNVALNLASLARKDARLKANGDKLSIERLILLAGPVQEATKRYVRSSLFKQIISFYSVGDLIQVIDPQGLQEQGKKRSKKKNNNVFFSHRVWPKADNIIQAQVCFERTLLSRTFKQPLLHSNFIQANFIKHLPDAIKKLSTPDMQKKDHCSIILGKNGVQIVNDSNA